MSSPWLRILLHSSANSAISRLRLSLHFCVTSSTCSLVKLCPENFNVAVPISLSSQSYFPHSSSLDELDTVLVWLLLPGVGPN